MNELEPALAEVGLKLNGSKTVAMTKSNGDVTVGGESAKVVPSVIYLGAQISLDGSQLGEIKRRCRAGMFAFNNYRSFFVKRAVPMTLKRKLFHSSVTPAFLYASDNWSATKRQYDSVAVAPGSLERAMLGITLVDRRTNYRVRLVTRLRDVQEQCILSKWSNVRQSWKTGDGQSR